MSNQLTSVKYPHGIKSIVIKTTGYKDYVIYPSISSSDVFVSALGIMVGRTVTSVCVTENQSPMKEVWKEAVANDETTLSFEEFYQ